MFKVLLLFSRDTQIQECFPTSASGCQPARSFIKKKFAAEECSVVYPPNGIIPFYGFSMLGTTRRAMHREMIVSLSFSGTDLFRLRRSDSSLFHLSTILHEIFLPSPSDLRLVQCQILFLLSDLAFFTFPFPFPGDRRSLCFVRKSSSSN